MNTYYNEDMSLSEIAEEFNISRQGVLDNVKKGEKKLLEYEEKLHILENQENRKNKLDKVLNTLSKNITQKEIDTIIKTLKEID